MRVGTTLLPMCRDRPVGTRPVVSDIPCAATKPSASGNLGGRGGWRRRMEIIPLGTSGLVTCLPSPVLNCAMRGNEVNPVGRAGVMASERSRRPTGRLRRTVGRWPPTGDPWMHADGHSAMGWNEVNPTRCQPGVVVSGGTSRGVGTNPSRGHQRGAGSVCRNEAVGTCLKRKHRYPQSLRVPVRQGEGTRESWLVA